MKLADFYPICYCMVVYEGCQKKEASQNHPEIGQQWRNPMFFGYRCFFPRKLPYSIANHYSAFMKTGASCRVAQLGEKLKSSAEVFQTASGYALYKHIYILYVFTNSQVCIYRHRDLYMLICIYLNTYIYNI